MNIDHLDTFLDLVETRNFNRTAGRLDLNQSTVSFRVRALEKALGARLFVRGRGGAELTPEGEKFESYALNLRLGWNLARQEIGMSTRFGGRLRVGLQIQLWDRLVNDWGVELCRRLPDIAVQVAADYSKAMTDQIVFGNLDVAVLYNPEHRPELHVEHIFDEAFLMVATQPRKLDEIVPEQYILIAESPYFQARHAELLPHLEQPALSISIGTMSAECLRERGGAAYLPARMAEPLIGSGEFFAVEDAPVIHQPLHITYHFRNRHRPNVQTAIEVLQGIDINTQSQIRRGQAAASGAEISTPAAPSRDSRRPSSPG